MERCEGMDRDFVGGSGFQGRDEGRTPDDSVNPCMCLVYCRAGVHGMIAVVCGCGFGAKNVCVRHTFSGLDGDGIGTKGVSMCCCRLARDDFWYQHRSMAVGVAHAMDRDHALASSQGQGNGDDDVFVKYNKSRIIGQGGFGKVYKGYHRKIPGFVVALKFANDNVVAEREIAILNRLKHDCIVPLWDHIEFTSSRDVAVLVFPWRESDLHEFRRRRDADYYMGPARGTFANDRSIIELWSHHLARGVAYTHSCNLVHRDLKPSNILLKWKAGGCTSRSSSS